MGSIYLSINLPTYLSIYLSILFIYLIYLSIYLSIYIYIELLCPWNLSSNTGFSHGVVWISDGPENRVWRGDN